MGAFRRSMCAEQPLLLTAAALQNVSFGVTAT